MVSLYGFRRELWKTGCIRIWAGSSNLQLVGDAQRTLKGPYRRGASLAFGCVVWRFVASSRTWSSLWNVCDSLGGPLFRICCATSSSTAVSRASPAPPDLKRGSHTKPPSPPNLPLKPSYSQIVKTKIQARDPGAMARAPAMKGSRYWEVPGSIPTKDNYLARDPENLSCASSRDPLLASAPRDQSHDLIRSRDPTPPRDQARFGRATRPLTNTWKTVGTNQRSTRSQGIPQGIPHSLSPMDTGTGNALIGLRA